jgi:hypothetical protein
MTMGASAHLHVGYKPNFDNPDPSEFPKIELKMIVEDRKPEAAPTPGTASKEGPPS